MRARPGVPQGEDLEESRTTDEAKFVGASMPPDGKIDTTGIPTLCLFPNILQITSGGETAVVHQGGALFPTSHVWIQAVLEKEYEESWPKRYRTPTRRSTLKGFHVHQARTVLR